MKSTIQTYFMLSIVIVLGYLLTLQTVSAKDALYIVPTDPELVQFSRFNIKIVEPYKNQSTQKIAYEFPEILVGEKNKVIEFLKEPGTENSWQAEEAEAHCSTFSGIFSCNIHLNKNSLRALAIDLVPNEVQLPKILSKDLSLENLKQMAMPTADLLGFTRVVEDFFSNEPAGILIYEI